MVSGQVCQKILVVQRSFLELQESSLVNKSRHKEPARRASRFLYRKGCTQRTSDITGQHITTITVSSYFISVVKFLVDLVQKVSCNLQSVQLSEGPHKFQTVISLDIICGVMGSYLWLVRLVELATFLNQTLLIHSQQPLSYSVLLIRQQMLLTPQHSFHPSVDGVSCPWL